MATKKVIREQTLIFLFLPLTNNCSHDSMLLEGDLMYKKNQNCKSEFKLL